MTGLYSVANVETEALLGKSVKSYIRKCLLMIQVKNSLMSCYPIDRAILGQYF